MIANKEIKPYLKMICSENVKEIGCKNKFELAGYSKEQSEDLLNISEKLNLLDETLINALNDFKEQLMSLENMLSYGINYLSYLSNDVLQLNTHEVHMAKYSKKKRVRKKYENRLIERCIK